MPSYRYLLCDLLTDRLLAVLPLTGVEFGRRLCRTGSLSGSMTAETPKQIAKAKLLDAYAGRAALWVYRDNALWWGGIPWTVTPSQGPRDSVKIDVQAATFDSYAHHRRLYADATYAQTDDGVIVADLWRRIQADPRGDIGVIAEDQPTGVLTDATYLASDHTPVGQLIENLGDTIDGPEHTIEVSLGPNGERVKRLRVAKRIGLTQPRAVFQRAVTGGGRIIEWGHTRDAVDGGTTFQTRGDAPNGNAGEEKEPLLSEHVFRDDLLDAGYPLLDVTEDRAGTTQVATLDQYAQALSVSNGGALSLSGYSVEVGNTGWSPNRLGDAVRLKLSDLWHDGVDLTVRPVGCNVKAAEKGSPETVDLLLSEDD